MLVFNAAGFVLLYGLMRLQAVLPLNPQGFDPVAPDLAFNTAVSFVTNTNWQSYGGETTMSHLVQMAGLTVQNFLSAATGMALAVAFVRAFARSGADHRRQFLGRSDPRRRSMSCCRSRSCWRSRSSCPACRRRCKARSMRPRSKAPSRPSRSARSPRRKPSSSSAPTAAASSTPIAAHPFENPNAISNILSIWSMLLIAAALPYTFGRMVGDTRQGWALLAAMLAILVAGVARRLLGGSARQSDPDRARPRSVRRQHGGQGGPLRRRHVGALRGGHDRALVRLRQCHA